MKKLIRPAILTYLLTWLGVFLLIVSVIAANSGNLSEALDTFVDLVPRPSFLKGFHLLFLVVFLLFLLTRYFVRTFQKKGIKVFLKRLTLFVMLPSLFLAVSFKGLIHLNSQEDFDFEWNSFAENQSDVSRNLFEEDEKHRGMSVFGWSKNNTQAINALVKNNVEWVAVIPFLYQETETTATIDVREDYNNWSRRDSIFIRSILELHEKGIHVQLKPHLWMSDGWRSNITLPSKTAWDEWFRSYRINMLHYAKMAQEMDVALFCVGTELKTSIREQPEKWNQLISEIKTIYKGELTYAANWDEDFETIKFWNELDYIGIQAYFPLTEAKNPDLQTIKKGWKRHIKFLENLAKKYHKPILFTEVGYKSEASATIKPWEWGSALSILYKKKSDKTQALAYQALFEELWYKEWFAGLYVWEWDTRTTKKSAEKSLNFSPRYKPAEHIIAKWFGMK